MIASSLRKSSHISLLVSGINYGPEVFENQTCSPAGFDLVGNENTLRPLLYYIEPLMNFRQRCEELSLDIPFIFHAGETLGDGTEADDNLYDAILLGTKRIGHGQVLVILGWDA